LRHHRLLTAACVAGLLAAASAGTGFSGAFVADQGPSAGNAAGAGALELEGTADGTVLVSDAPMRPGVAPREGLTRLRNGGSLPGALYARLSVPAEASAALLAALQVQVHRCDDESCAGAQRVFPAGAAEWAPLSTLSTRLLLGALEPGDERLYRTRIAWPEEADDPALYGIDAPEGLRLRWSLRTLPSAAGGND
jgi:hypothetical protein